MIASPLVILVAISLLAPMLAARARQDAVRTASFRFKRTETSARSGVSDPSPGSGRLPAPIKIVKTESTNRLVIAGECYRYEDNHPALFLPAGRVVPRSAVTVCDGARTYLMSSNLNAGTADIMSAIVTDDANLGELLRPEIAPIWHSFRSARWVAGLRPTGAVTEIDGARAVEYGGTNGLPSYWLLPAKAYVVGRIQARSQGRLSSQVDIGYRPHDVAGWVPTFWESHTFSTTGKEELTTRIEVLDMRINEEMPAELFDPKLPPGIVILDQRDHKQYRIAADGSRRELGNDGLELPAAQEVPRTWFEQNRKWLFRLFVAIGLLPLAWQMFLRRRKKA